MRAKWMLFLFLAAWLGGPLAPAQSAPQPGAAECLLEAQGAIKTHHYRKAIDQLYPATRRAGFAKDPMASALLLALGEQAEAYVHLLNQRYRKRSRLDPHSPSWRPYVRLEQNWAERHLAAFDYDEPRARYRSMGEAYKLLVAKYPGHPAAEEASWRLLLLFETSGNRRSDPALRDADRYRHFLKTYPATKHRRAAMLAIGWDYLYASGFTWGPPDRELFRKGEHILRDIMAQAPGSREAHQARALLTKTRNPFGYAAVMPATPSK